MTVREADVPGVGKKYELEVGGGERMVLVVHHDGKREMFRKPGPDADAERVFVLDSEQAARVASLIQGVDFQPIDPERVDVSVGGAVLDWVRVPDGSPLVGQSLEKERIRREVGVDVVAVQRAAETLARPAPDVTLRAGDVLIAIGSREQQRRLETFVETGDA
ncbi:MAG: cation:proton antiporter regulatory subunit [Halolamina sp.]